MASPAEQHSPRDGSRFEQLESTPEACAFRDAAPEREHHAVHELRDPTRDAGGRGAHHPVTTFDLTYG